MTLKSRLTDLAARMPDGEKPDTTSLLGLKFAVLLMLDEIDAKLNYGHPGRAIDQMLGTTPNVVSINAHKEAAE